MVLHSFLELSSYTIMGAGVRSEGVGSIDEPDSSAWLSVWGSVCVGLVFRRWVRQNVRNSTLRQLWGTHCMKTVEEEGPGWWVGTLWCPCGAPLTNERRMPVELCIGGNKRSRKSILLLVTAPEVRNV